MPKRRKINPTVDIIFKAIFGAEKRKKLLIDFLNCLFIESKMVPIEEVVIQNPYTGHERLTDKEIILDIKVKDKQNRIIQIEMQADPYTHIEKRMIYNNATILSKTLEKGDDYFNVKEVISIWVLGNNLDNHPEGLDIIQLKSQLGRGNFDLQKIIIAESSKLFSKGDRLSKWMYIINRWDDYSLENPPQWMINDEIFKEVIKVVDIFAMNDEEFDYYLARKNYQMDVSLREFSGFEKGMKQGLEQGLEQGHRKGVKEGILTGKTKLLFSLLQSKFNYPKTDPNNILFLTNEKLIDSCVEKLVHAEKIEEIYTLLK